MTNSPQNAKLHEKTASLKIGASDPHYPRHLLFLSADIVGSTALKQPAGFSPYFLDQEGDEAPETLAARIGDLEKWFDILNAFYEKSHEIISAEFGEIKANLWKTIGDEIIYYVDIKQHDDIVKSLKHWIESSDAIRKHIKSLDGKLDVKCTSWLAEFPVENKVIFTNKFSDACKIDSDFDDRVRNCGGDFVGPAIDIGFRLAQISTSRKFVISLDIAYFISRKNENNTVDLFYEGRKYLKGVAGGVEYPIFWIDTHGATNIDKKEDNLLKNQKCTTDSASAFCEAFYDDSQNPSTRPFIISDTSDRIKEPKSGYVLAYGLVASRRHKDGQCAE